MPAQHVPPDAAALEPGGGVVPGVCRVGAVQLQGVLGVDHTYLFENRSFPKAMILLYHDDEEFSLIWSVSVIGPDCV